MIVLRCPSCRMLPMVNVTDEVRITVFCPTKNCRFNVVTDKEVWDNYTRRRPETGEVGRTIVSEPNLF